MRFDLKFMGFNLFIILLCMVLGTWGDYPPGTEPTRNVNQTYQLI